MTTQKSPEICECGHERKEHDRFWIKGCSRTIRSNSGLLCPCKKFTQKSPSNHSPSVATQEQVTIPVKDKKPKENSAQEGTDGISRLGKKHVEQLQPTASSGSPNQDADAEIIEKVKEWYWNNIDINCYSNEKQMDGIIKGFEEALSLCRENISWEWIMEREPYTILMKEFSALKETQQKSPSNHSQKKENGSKTTDLETTSKKGCLLTSSGSPNQDEIIEKVLRKADMYFESPCEEDTKILLKEALRLCRADFKKEQDVRENTYQINLECAREGTRKQVLTEQDKAIEQELSVFHDKVASKVEELKESYYSGLNKKQLFAKIDKIFGVGE